MMKHLFFLLLLGMILPVLIGCSSGAVDPVAISEPMKDATLEDDYSSSRLLWGVWDIYFDLENLTAEVSPSRDVQMHYDVTPFLTPPNCSDCVVVTVNSFDPDTRILDADATIKNPYPFPGYDVRGIVYTNFAGHELRNADDWTDLYEIDGGESINPFRSYAKGEPNRFFGGQNMHVENFKVYIPSPPMYWAIKYAVDVSYPGNCGEPYMIDNFQQEPIDPEPMSMGNITVDVFDWQDDVNQVYISVPQITSEETTQLAKISGNTWGVTLMNMEGAAAGDYPALITVRSETGGGQALYDKVMVTISGEPQWHLYTVQSGEAVDRYTALCVVDGRPAVTYHGSHVLKYAHASDALGSIWPTAINAAEGGDLGAWSSLIIVNGNPGACFYDDTIFGLRYARATDVPGDNWAPIVTIDSSLDVGRFTSMTIVNGNPAISYWDANNYDMMYVRANDPDGTSWASPHVVYSSGNTGYHSSLTVVNGKPAISFFSSAPKGDLFFVRAIDENGTNWGAALTIDGPGPDVVGQWTSLAVVDGTPAVSYFDKTHFDLRFVRATDADGFFWDDPMTIDSSGNVGEYSSLEIINGLPSISYYDQGNGNLKYIQALDAGGVNWGEPVTVDDSVSDLGGHTCLREVMGNPGISYYDYTTSSIKYAVYY